MSNELTLSFVKRGNGVKCFSDFAKLHLNFVSGDLYIILEVFVYNCTGFEFLMGEGSLLFSKEFTFKVESLETLKKMNEEGNSSFVKRFFTNFFPESDFLTELSERADMYMSQEVKEPVYFDAFGEACEFLQVDDETSFYGNFEHDGKQGISANIYHDDEYDEYRLNLSGTDDYDMSLNFYCKQDLEKELERLRRIQPINKCDLQKYIEY